MAMDKVNNLHMNPGDGESSYASNSLLQETVIQKALPVLKHTIKSMSSHDSFSSQCFKIADLGCSSGKNTLLVASNIIRIVIEACKENNCKPPQFEVCLNDLFGNDFNTLFKLLPDFYAKLRKEKEENSSPCFVSAVPGSFYGRLFPNQSLHLVHSSYSLHWLSQVPEGLESNALNIYITKTSPPNVFQAYGKKFKTDFTKFLQMRSEEIVCGGRMVLTFVGRSVVDPTSDDGCSPLWEVLAQSLLDMAKEGLVQESDIISFNVPVYYPCEDEVRNIIENEGIFSFECLTTFQVNWDPQDTDYKDMKALDEASQTHGENTAKMVRAGTEPMLVSHFGKSIIDKLFQKYGKHVAQHQSNKKSRFFNFVISLRFSPIIPPTSPHLPNGENQSDQLVSYSQWCHGDVETVASNAGKNEGFEQRYNQKSNYALQSPDLLHLKPWLFLNLVAKPKRTAELQILTVEAAVVEMEKTTMIVLVLLAAMQGFSSQRTVSCGIPSCHFIL
ncbi:hypothetical protein L1987_58848 [Smallanthus sonchifolius]|uniref:Uncharacterized protein n=1 Tax=Smallanthus sonchifolius TaxID=185202 RepID=A0ACB9D3T4_9ASTR|nr:hypothetical protein L1987_58848 [Smallanthus sonchifolius]